MPATRTSNPGKPSGQGKGILQRALIETGMSRRRSALIVDTVIDTWKNALARHEDVELPIGTLRVANIRKRRVFKLKPNLKGIKRKIYDIFRQPHTVQLVKKKLPGEPANLPLELAEPGISRALLGNTNEPTNRLTEERLLFRFVGFAHLTAHDLRQRGRG